MARANSAEADAAAIELWDLIHHTPRFSSSQKDRTLYHPLLVQPEPRQKDAITTTKTRKDDMESDYYCNQRGGENAVCKDVNTKSLPLGEQIKIAIANGVKSDGFDGSAVQMKDLHNNNASTTTPRNNVSPTSTLDPYAFIYNDSHAQPAGDGNPSKILMHRDDQLQPEVLVEDENTSDSICNRTGAGDMNEMNRRSVEHSFVVCADTQFGMRDLNESWEFELEISRRTVAKINQMRPLPAFVSVCGDLVDMEFSFYENKPKSPFSMDMCHEIQDKQNKDFQDAWGQLDDRVALVCLCGNHDVGNRPTRSSIQRFNRAFGDDYLSFWCNGTFNVVVNTNTFSNPDGAPELLDQQLEWLERELKHAKECGADQIFAFGHHPWFLYNEDEVKDDLVGVSPFPNEWGPPPSLDAGFPDHYFHIKRENRQLALNLFREYGVTASFCGHFHQNLVSKTKWGMHHIVTAPLSIYFESTGKPLQEEENGVGFRLIRVRQGHFEHEFVKL
eukprot:CAMPEP_0116022490 /NCGR_PEP_ID=MMETSP0321-20121206/11021_1 /TAXON_ID=163516 /ORGANISM="Leptocylindrus danicus var. danicus, Strain B650" /LENGTH=501 /DNA_ID=CAMNT_0003493577 /DNA_START=523 /DNA_END=2028 /DNA_ORIENTATION=+